MLPPNLAGVLLALSAAGVWGTADFSGGYASRRANQYHVLGVAALSGMIVLIALAVAFGEPVPDRTTAAWALAAGASGGVGLACLYRVLSLGHAARIAPVAAVVGASVPVVAGIASDGLPRALVSSGLVAAIAGIWLVTRSPGDASPLRRSEIVLAVTAGLGFGGFLVFIARTDPALLFGPLTISRTATMGVAVAMIVGRRHGPPALLAHPFAWIAGVLDAGGNALYLLAASATRMDVAAVLSSLYPAATVMLAYAVLDERLTPTQWLGVVVCLVGIVLVVA